MSITNSLTTILHAIAVLEEHKLPTRIVVEAVQARLSEEGRQPTEADQRWPREVAGGIEDHLALGMERPILSCRLMLGRAYGLTPGQRNVLKERFGMTPARLVEVTEVAQFPGTNLIRRVTLQSCEHVDLGRRHIVKRLVIDNWGQFCDMAKMSDDQRAEAHVASEDNEPTTKGGAKAVKRPNYEDLAEYAV